MLSWRTKEAKLLCLKFLGRRSRSNSARRHTTNAVPDSFQEMVSSVSGSSTIAYVLVRNGGVPAPSAGDAIDELVEGDGSGGALARGDGDSTVFYISKNLTVIGSSISIIMGAQFPLTVIVIIIPNIVYSSGLIQVSAESCKFFRSLSSFANFNIA